MIEPIEVEIEAFSFKGVEIIESLPDLLVMTETSIEYKWKLKAKTKEDGVEKERKYQGSKNILKNKITGVQALWDEEKDCYTCSIFASNEECMVTAYKTFPEALKIKNIILGWLIS